MKYFFLHLIFCWVVFIPCQSQDLITICKHTCSNAQGQISFQLTDKSCSTAPQEIYSCAPFACDERGETCRLICDDNRGCAKGFVCDKQTSKCFRLATSCVDDLSLISTSGTNRSCEPYRCSMGACRTFCKADNDCFPGHKCLIDAGHMHMCAP
jgi:hypothetical protein